MATNINDSEKRLWQAADELRANSKLKASEFSVPALGLTFLRYADHRFAQAQKELEGFLRLSFGARKDGPPRRPSPCYFGVS